MVNVQQLLDDLSDPTIGERVRRSHDVARNSYRLRTIVPSCFEEYIEILGDYVNHHYAACITRGAFLSKPRAIGRARELIEHFYRRRGGDIKTAFQDAQVGTVGLGAQLDVIRDALKEEALEDYITAAIESHASPTSWPDKVELTRQIFAHFGNLLGPAIDLNVPERYAASSHELVKAVAQALQHAASEFRRL